MNNCSLCHSTLGPVLRESELWRLVLNHNQNLLGKCMLVLRRHLEAVPHLSPAEWIDLQQELVRATQALTLVFQPDHFNYAFLQNQDRHVHVHVIPRYAQVREVANLTFDDPDYPDHYAVPAPTRHLVPEQQAMISEQLRQVLAAGQTVPVGWRCSCNVSLTKSTDKEFQHGS